MRRWLRFTHGQMFCLVHKILLSDQVDQKHPWPLQSSAIAMTILCLWFLLNFDHRTTLFHRVSQHKSPAE
jgi:hypothetical protein